MSAVIALPGSKDSSEEVTVMGQLDITNEKRQPLNSSVQNGQRNIRPTICPVNKAVGIYSSCLSRRPNLVYHPSRPPNTSLLLNSHPECNRNAGLTGSSHPFTHCLDALGMSCVCAANPYFRAAVRASELATPSPPRLPTPNALTSRASASRSASSVPRSPTRASARRPVSVSRTVARSPRISPARATTSSSTASSSCAADGVRIVLV